MVRRDNSMYVICFEKFKVFEVFKFEMNVYFVNIYL